jgi:hypothetical protein
MAFAMCVVFYSTVFAVSRRCRVGSHPADEHRSAAKATAGGTLPESGTAADDGAHVLSPGSDELPAAREGAITVRAAHVEDAESARPVVEARLAEESKRWQLAAVVPGEHGETLEHRVRLKKKAEPHEGG